MTHKSPFLSRIPNPWKASVLTGFLGLLLLLMLGVGGGLLVHVVLGMAPPTKEQANRTYEMVVVSVMVAPFIFFLGWMAADLTKMMYRSILESLERRRYRIRH
jgi:hypothetical protein